MFANMETAFFSYYFNTYESVKANFKEIYN